MKRLFYLNLLLCALTLGCDKNIDVSKYDAHPLKLKVIELQGNTYKITWNALPSSDFIDYQLIRAINDTVPDMLPTDTIFRTSSLVARIGDRDQTTFLDSVTIAGGKIAFRLFARYRDHSVSSVNVIVTGQDNITELVNIEDQIFYSKQASSFVFVDKARDLVTTMNIKNNQFQSTTLAMEDATTMSFNDDESSIYTANSFGVIQTIHPSTFTITKHFFTNTRNAPFSVGGSGKFAYCSMRDAQLHPTDVAIRLFENVDFGQELQRLTLLNSIAWQLFKAPNSDDLFAIEPNIETAQVMVFRNLSQNRLNEQKDYNSNHANFIDASRFLFAPDGSFFITGKQGNLYSLQMTLSKQLNVNGNYSDFYIDNNLNIYAATNRRIDIYNAPNYNWTRSVVCRLNPTKIFVLFNQAYLFAPSVNKLGNTTLEKINL
jgi:hypothetical protein